MRVSCENGIVTLDGVILDERERAALRVVAEGVAGVKGVKDELVWADPNTGMTVSAEDLRKPIYAGWLPAQARAISSLIAARSIGRGFQ